MFSVQIDTARTWRGGQNQVFLTVQGLRALGHRVVLVAHPDGELRRRAEEGGEVLPLAASNEMDFPAGWQLSRALRDLAPDVVHAHDPHAVAAAAVALSIGTRAPRPVLVASRRVDFHLRGNSFSRWKYRQVDGVIAASEAIGAMLAQDGIPRDRIHTVHEGIDVDRVASIAPANVRAEFWMPTQVPVVGAIGALVPHKGHRYLIDAVPTVMREFPDVRLVIMGEGELRPTLERQIRDLHLEKHVILTGFRTDVLSVLKGFDVFVMSSVTEGLGTSLLDAMAAARPVVATTAGGIPEVVVDGETGLLVPPRDARRLAEAIIALLGNPAECERMGRAGLARVQERFSAARMVAGTLAVYERLLAERRS